MKTFNEWWKFRHPRTGIYNHERVEDTSGQSSRLAWDAAMEEAQLVITLLQEQLAERDRLLEQREATILEQQARIEELTEELEYLSPHSSVLVNEDGQLDNLSALEAALKAERIKTLEDAKGHFADTPKGREVKEELTRMANALKEQS